jgi:dolichol-phosphate mannosyltransferase
MNGIVITPTYNEVDGIVHHLQQILNHSIDLDVLVVDDESPDGTAEKVLIFAKSNPGVFLLSNGKKMGIGGAYIAGFKWCLEREYDFVIQMDADGSHPYETLPLLVKEIRTYDLVIGSRYVRGGQLVNWPKSREWVSKVGNFLARQVVSVAVEDVTGGFKAISAKKLNELNFECFEVQGYAFQIDLLRNLTKDKIEFIEVPITFTERVSGKSKMTFNIIAEAIKMIAIWSIKDFLKSRKVNSSNS